MHTFSSVPSSRALVAALLCLLLGSCGENTEGPAGPSQIASNGENALSLADATGLRAATLEGKVTNILNGKPVRNVRITLAGIAVTTSGENGAFAIGLPGSETYVLRAEAEGYHPRRTRVSGGVSSREVLVKLELMPKKGGFDLDFYDHVFRRLGESETHRWATEPEIVFFENAFECAEPTQDRFCSRLISISDKTPQSFISMATDVFTIDGRKYTGGALDGSNITVQRLKLGTVLTREQLLVRGQIRVAFIARGDNNSWVTWNWFRTSRDMFSGHIQFNRRHRGDRNFFSHLFAHILGFGHPRGTREVPLPSSMRSFEGPSRPDIMHGRVLYRRPSGSMSPDLDRDDFVLNSPPAFSLGAPSSLKSTSR